MKFNVSHDPQEIEKVIKKSIDDNDSIVWQTNPVERTVYQIEKIHVDNLRKILRFKLENMHKEQLDPQLHVYVKLAFRNTIFKGDLIGSKDNFIFVNIPDEIQFEELREFPRFSFKPQEDKSVTMSISSKLLSNSSYNLKVKLLDISQTGLGLLVSKANHDLFRNNKLMMIALGDIELENAISTDIMHSGDYSYKLNGKLVNGFKVGTKLDGFLEKKLLDNYIRSVEGFDFSSIGFLGSDAQFKNSLYIQMEAMFSKLKKKNDLFNSLDQAQASALMTKENEYFPRHIKTLAKVSAGIAQLMGIGTKTVINKLIYASFVHDVAFYANPKLSLIKNINHFELLQKELSAEEKKLFKNAPKYAFDFAFYDKYAPKGVENILIQTKELPNGKGYPNHIDAKKISLLSAIFIVAHDLTDFIYERKSWNYHDYLLGYHKKFKGGFFDEIMILLDRSLEKAA